MQFKPEASEANLVNLPESGESHAHAEAMQSLSNPTELRQALNSMRSGDANDLPPLQIVGDGHSDQPGTPLAGPSYEVLTGPGTPVAVVGLSTVNGAPILTGNPTILVEDPGRR